MAKRDLKKFLTKLDAELRRSSEDYRKTVSDVKAHQFHLTKEGLLNEALFQAQRQGVTRSKGKIKEATDQYFDDIVAAFKTMNVNDNNPNYSVFDKKVTSNSFTITFQTVPAKIKKALGDLIKTGSTFDSIKFLIAPAKQKFHSKMKKIYKNKGVEFSSSFFQDIGHDEEATVYDNKVLDALLSSGQIPPAAFKMEELAAVLELHRDDESGIISVTLESASKNRTHGTFVKKKAKKIQADIAKALDKLPSLALTAGSDTPATQAGKRAGKKVLQSFKKIKNAKVIIKDDLELDEKKSIASLKLKRSITSSKSKGRKTRKPKRTQGGAKVASKPLQLMANLNKALPQVIKKNMKEPGLVNRTGRFAGSVEVTDVITTAKGFPSVGYSYDRENYGQYEATSGSRFASTDRDPRRLIDKSIREIAAKAAMGRFFTRRN